MDTQSAISFAASAPFIATIIGFVAGALPQKIGHGWYPFAALILASVWGVVLKQGGYWEGSAATFVVTDLTVAYAVAGIMSQARNTGISVSVGRAAPDAAPDSQTATSTGVSADQVIAIVEQAIDKMFPRPVPAPVAVPAPATVTTTDGVIVPPIPTLPPLDPITTP